VDRLGLCSVPSPLHGVLGSVPNSVAHSAHCLLLVFDSLSERGETGSTDGAAKGGDSASEATGD